MVEFYVAKGAARQYYVYYGNPKAQAAAKDWDRKIGGLYLETRNNPGSNAQSWEHMQKLLSGSTVSYGRGARDEINDSHNPFGQGQDDMFLSIYKGEIFCPETGEYGFATDSDDASFLLIDGNVVAQWPGGHVPSQTWENSGTISLKRGIHRIEYYHAETYGGQLSKAGWKLPSEKAFTIIPSRAFVRELPSRPVRREMYGEVITAHFMCEEKVGLRLNTDRTMFPTVGFTDCSASFYGKPFGHAWDFGDGAFSAEQNPVHEYARTGVYDVTLTVIDTLGYRDTLQKRIDVRAPQAERATISFDLHSTKNIVYAHEEIELVLRATCTSNRPLDMVLTSTVAQHSSGSKEAGGASVVQRDRRVIRLEPKTWHAAELSFPNRTGRNEMTFVLSYLDRPVAEKRLTVLPTREPFEGIELVDEALSRGKNLVVLKLPSPPQDPRCAASSAKIDVRGVQRMVVIDDSLSPVTGRRGAPTTYYGILKELMEKAGLVRDLKVTRVGVYESSSGYPPLLRLTNLYQDVVAAKPDLVLVACSLQEISDCLPLDDFQRYLAATVDQVLSQSKAHVVVISAPPLVDRPKLSRKYALAAKRIGLEKGVPVVDAYSLFLRRGSNRWQVLYRDGMREDRVSWLNPTLRGQRAIAEEISRRF